MLGNIFHIKEMCVFGNLKRSPNLSKTVFYLHRDMDLRISYDNKIHRCRISLISFKNFAFIFFPLELCINLITIKQLYKLNKG